MAFERMQPAVVLNEEDALSKALSEMARNGIGVVITKNGKYYGVIEDTCIRQIPSDPSNAKAITFAATAPTLATINTLAEACEIFVNNASYRALPLMQGERIIGMLTLADVLYELKNAQEAIKGKVSEAMNPVKSIEQTESIAQAKALMRNSGTNKLIVTTNGKFVGVVTTHDVNTALAQPREKTQYGKEKTSASEQPIASLARESIEVIAPGDSLAKAAELMTNGNISNLIVAENGKPTGIITAIDVLKTIAQEAEKIPVHITGLDDEDKEYAVQIKSYCEKTLEKMGKTQEIQCLKLTVKKTSKTGLRHRYTVLAQLQADKPLNTNCEDWDLLKAVHGALDETKKAFAKKKHSPIHKKK
ncbi:CBS domain-containing protein [Candidatus Micrarchaeota archaeon]|nr:CBS domain-containing protein [Candidatus Micrarchaeota archaeon]